MIHTIQIKTRITEDEYYGFISLPTIRKVMFTSQKKFQRGYIYEGLTHLGIRQILVYRNAKDYCCCYATVNPQKVITGNPHTIKPFNPTKENLELFYQKFSLRMEKVFPQKSQPYQWETVRVDYVVDIQTEYVKEYIELLQRGKHPNKMILSRIEQHRVEKEKSHYKGSVRYENDSITVNIYDKEKERTDKKAPFDEIAQAHNILRVEIQCKEEKIKSMLKSGVIASKQLDILMETEILSSAVVLDYLQQVECRGQYFSIPKAKKIIDNYPLIKEETKTELKDFIDIVGQRRNLRKVLPEKEKEYGNKRVQRILNLFEKLNVNPVTIPYRWKPSNLPSVISLLEEEIRQKNG